MHALHKKLDAGLFDETLRKRWQRDMRKRGQRDTIETLGGEN